MLRPKLRIRATIVVMFVVLTIPLFFGIVALNYSSNQAAARSNAYSLIERFHDEANESIENLLSPIKSMISSATVIGKDVPQFYTDNGSLPYLLSIEHHSDKLVSVYVGWQDGSFRQARQVSPDVKIQGQLPPSGVKDAFRWIDPSDGKAAIDHYTYLDGTAQPIGTSEAPTSYDPRARAWYQQAVAERRLLITDPEVFAALGLIGFTIAAPIFDHGKIAGVAAADITLDGLSSFLAEHKISPGTLSYILNAKSEVMAASDGGKTYQDNGSQVSLLHVTAMASQLPSVAYSARPRDANADKPYEFSFEGQTYVASWAMTSKNIGKNWQFFTITPLHDFTTVFDKTNERMLYLGALVIIAEIIAMHVLAKTISTPLERLATNVAKIERLEGDKLTLTSSISEIAVLAKAIEKLGSTVESFSAFVPISLVRQLVNSDQQLELGGHSRFLTIFFSDLEAFSTLSEEVPTQELMRRVSAYLELVTHAINAEHGTVDKFIGDGVMAFWGAPALLDNHALHACLAALRIQHEMDALNERWKADDYKPLRVRIGMHSDAVLVGNIGCRERVGYTVMGDGVNVAARLEGVNKQYGTKICISHSVFKEAGERLCVRPIDEVTVKGRRGRIAIYELLGAYGAGPDLEPDAATERLCRLTRNAHQALIHNDIGLAITGYEEVLAEFPGDPVAIELLKRLTAADLRRIPAQIED